MLSLSSDNSVEESSFQQLQDAAYFLPSILHVYGSGS
jgi:hypothetical protein